MLILFLYVFSSGSPGDYWSGTHTFILRQAQKILRNDGKVLYADFLDSLNNGKTYLEWMIDGNNENDDALWKASHHYMDPADHEGWSCDDPFYDEYDDNLFDFLQMPSWTLCQQVFDSAVKYWNLGDRAKAMYYLGWSAHLVQDACVPQHSYPTAFWGHSDFEGWVEENQNLFAVYSGGIYSFEAFGGSYYIPHYDSAQRAKDWVDFNAHFSYQYFLCADDNYGFGYDDEMEIETSHPYPNNYDHTYTIKLYGADTLWIYIDSLEIESYYDTFIIYDRFGNIVWYSETQNVGIVSYSDFVIGPVLGDEVRIRLVTDGSVNAWGYKTLAIEWNDTIDISTGYYLAAQNILSRAQRTTAGFINFFFETVGYGSENISEFQGYSNNIPSFTLPIKLYDVSGRKIKREFLSLVKKDKSISPGVYFAILKNKNKIKRRKILVIK